MTIGKPTVEEPPFKSVDEILAEVRKDIPPDLASQEYEPPKRKGRGKRKREPTPADLGISKDACVFLVGHLTNFIAERKGPQWSATPEEAKAIGESLDRVLAKYFPMLLAYQEEAALALVVSMYFVRAISQTPIRVEVTAVPQ